MPSEFSPIESWDSTTMETSMPQDVRAQLREFGGGREHVPRLKDIHRVHLHFVEAGKEHLLQAYYRLLKVYWERFPVKDSAIFPFRDPKQALAELLEWENMGDFKEAALEIAEHALRFGNEDFFFYKPVFSSFDDAFQSGEFPIGEVMKQLAGESLSQEEKDFLATLHKNYPHLGASLIHLLLDFQNVQKIYPGGVRALLEDLEAREIQNVDGFLASLITMMLEWGSDFTTLAQNPKKLDEFFQLSTFVFEQLGPKMTFEYLSGFFSLFLDQGEDGVQGLKEAVGLAGQRLRDVAGKAQGSVKHMEGLTGGMLLDYGLLLSLGKPANPSELARIYDGIFFGPTLKRKWDDPRYADVFQLLVRHGLDYRLAARLQPDQDFRLRAVDHPDLVPMTASGREFLEKMTSFLNWTHDKEDEGEFKLACATVQSEEEMRARLETLREMHSLIKREDFGLEGVNDVEEWLIGLSSEQITIPFWQRILTATSDAKAPALLDRRLDLKKSSWLQASNPTTQMAVMGESLRRVLVEDGVPRFGSSLHMETMRLLADAQDGEAELLLRKLLSVETEIRRAMAELIPLVEFDVRSARREQVGFLPVGMKCHTPAAMSDLHFRQHETLFSMGGFTNTPFQLIHGGKTLVMPPVPSPLEARYLLGTFHTFGTLSDTDPGIQLALGGGRWTPDRAAIVGSSILLSNHEGLKYAPGAFGSSHNRLTKSRIMVYDAGVKVEGLPYDLPQALGRTDILEQIHADSLDRYQILGTSAAHDQFDGPLARFWPDYVQQYTGLLDRAGLGGVYQEAAWVCAEDETGDGVDRHEAMVAKFTHAANTNPRLRRQVRRLVFETGNKIRALKSEIIRKNPEEFERLLNY